MSIRTVIEINHDQLHKLKDDPAEWAKQLYDVLSTGSWHAGSVYQFMHPIPSGARVLGQRHHSEELTLTVK